MKDYGDRQGKTPKCVQDFRQALDDKSVDAIVVATPDHWHAPAAIWGCQAEKDVYVEKPPTHNCWEGQKLIEAAEKYKRVVQVGTQNRSALLVHYANISLRTGGERLIIDPASEQITNSPAAMKLFKRQYRKPWVIPEKV